MSGVPAEILDLLAKNYSSKPEDKLTASELAQLKQLRAETEPEVWEAYLAAGKAERKRRKKLAKSQPSVASHRSQASPKPASRQGAASVAPAHPAPSSSVAGDLSVHPGDGASLPMWPTASDAGLSPASQARPSLPSGSPPSGSPNTTRSIPGMHWPAAHMEISSSSSEAGADRSAALAQQRGRTRHSVGSIASARSLPSASSSVVQGRRFASSTRSSRAKSKDTEAAAPVEAKPSMPQRSHTPSSAASSRSRVSARAKLSSAAGPVRSRLMAPTAASAARAAASAEAGLPAAAAAVPALPRRRTTPASRPAPAPAAAPAPAQRSQASAAQPRPSSKIRRGQGAALASAPQLQARALTPARASTTSNDALPAPSPGAVSAGLHSVSAAARAVLQNLQGVGLSQARTPRTAGAPPLGPALQAAAEEDGAEPGRPTSPWGTSALVQEGVLVLTPQRAHAADSAGRASPPALDQLGQAATPPSKARPELPSPLSERLRQLHLQASAVRSQHLAVAAHVRAQLHQFQQALEVAVSQVQQQQQQQQPRHTASPPASP